MFIDNRQHAIDIWTKFRIALLGTAASDSETSKDASFNFSVAKVIAIFTVAGGHWFTQTILWIPVTFGLFVFAFSSAYFSAKAYGSVLDKKFFWHKKLDRLAVRYWTALVFIAVLSAAKGAEVLDWESVIHVLGLSGFLNWFKIPNHSALGAGLWFFTLLLLFYIAYPYLVRFTSSKAAAMWISAIAFVSAVTLEEHVKVGHELWLTTLGFVLGVAYGVHQKRISPRLPLVGFACSCFALAYFNLIFKSNYFNTLLIALSSLFVSLWLSNTSLPKWRLSVQIARFEKYLLEVFLVHTYLFSHLTGNSFLDFIFSIILILCVSAALNFISGKSPKLWAVPLRPAAHPVVGRA